MSGSASIARTVYPSRAKRRAKVPARVVLPTPPFPEIAILIFGPPDLVFRGCEGMIGYITCGDIGGGFYNFTEAEAMG